MFRVEVPKIALGDIEPISITWQVSSNANFNNNFILLETTKSEDMYFLDVNLPLGEEDVYYVRNKYTFNTGDSKWSRIVKVTKHNTSFTTNKTIVVTPSINVYGNINNMPRGGFEITSSDFLLFTGEGNHLYTDWIIEDLNGKVVWSRYKDRYNLTKVRVPDNILNIEEVYIIKVRYTTNTNVSSYYGKLYINTITDKNSNIVKDATVTLLLTRPHTRADDKLFKNLSFKDGKYVLDNLKVDKAGRWILRVRVKVGDDIGFQDIPAYKELKK